ncbi:hypothetical protein ETB97_004336 [Aspergillus alliaceus]|uniref:Uncharacterized protein n=1 Tax=Petromyces alliaceus TaxID=209559 RepID=A0A8H6E4Y8_PETAA|nr:hypothetical protein ETB97_004336 [Aspergillus burnettii]
MSHTRTVNHTDFELTNAHPFLLNIETEKPVVHWDIAQLQLGSLAGMQLYGHSFGGWSFQQDNLTALSAVGAIPGAIIRTHRCILVLPTSEGGRLSHESIINLKLCKTAWKFMPLLLVSGSLQPGRGAPIAPRDEKVLVMDAECFWAPKAGDMISFIALAIPCPVMRCALTFFTVP